MKIHLHSEQFDGHAYPWCGRGTTAVVEKVFEATDPEERCQICDREWFPYGSLMVNQNGILNKRKKIMEIKTLDQWAVIHAGDPYQAPELHVQILVGKGSTTPEGKLRFTTAIVGKEGEYVVTRSGSRYKLLDVEPDYEALYPNARERLFKTLPEVTK